MTRTTVDCRRHDAARREVEPVVRRGARNHTAPGIDHFDGVAPPEVRQRQPLAVIRRRQRVGPGAATKIIVTIAGDQQVVAVTALQGIVASAADQSVVAGFAAQPVVTGTALKQVIAGAPPQVVVAFATSDRIVETAANDFL